MATIKVSREIAAPVEDVFALFTDIEHGAAHVSGIKGVEMMTFGEFRLGTKWGETREVLGRLDDAVMEITAFERNRSYTITHHKVGTRIDTTFTFEPFEDGTRIQTEFVLAAHGAPPGILAPMGWAMAGKVRDVITRDLADLKDSMEKRT